MTSSKRSWKLQEFVAHSANVTCLAIGPSSGRVMVTGGEDKKVNMWAIGKPNVILSLSGHTTPIECVQFNSSEELVCAGSQSGTLKIWDLEAAKMVRTLSGHKANIRSLDFHPYGDFVASGSIDTTVRLWDVRRKGCIVSYKGHTNAINHLRFSPDGRWVISAGEDSLVKLWDLNAGKLLADFALHTGPVNRVEFHPKELLMATGSSDRTVKFWDLEKYGLISSTDVEANPVRTICFHPEGLCLFSGGNDSLRAYSWEPSVCFDAQTLGWGKVSDMAFHSNQLIAASYQATNVSVWVVSVNELEDVIEKAVSQLDSNDPVQTAEQIPARKISPSRKSFNTRPKTTSSKPKQSNQKAFGLDEFNKVVDERLNNAPENVFQPKAALPRSPPSVKKVSPPPFTMEPPGIVPQKHESAHESRPVVIPQKKNSHPSPSPSPPISRSPQKVFYRPPSVNQLPFEPPETPKQQPAVSDETPSAFHQPHVGLQQQQRISVSNPRPQQVPKQQPPISDETPSAIHQPHVGLQQQQRISVPNPRSQQVPAQQQQRMSYPVQGQVSNLRQDHVLPVNDKMGELNLKDFAKAKEISVQTQNDEETTLSILQKNHVSLGQILEARLQNLALVQRLWTDGDIKGAVETASNMSDLSVLVDVMNVLSQRHTLWTLDLCVAVLMPLKSLISSNYESYVETGSSALKLIMKHFSPLIQSTLSTPPGALGVDLVHEERYRKCESCYRNLIEVRDILSGRTKSSGRIGVLCKELSIALSVFG